MSLDLLASMVRDGIPASMPPAAAPDHLVATASGVIAAVGFGFFCGCICGYGTAMGQLAAKHWRNLAGDLAHAGNSAKDTSAKGARP